jgi:DNA-binding transcriptional regulator PaaX
MKNYKKGEIAKIILLSTAVVGLTLLFIAAPGTAHIFQLFKAKNPNDRRRIVQAVKRLEAKKFVRIVRTKEGKALVITPKGKRELSRYKIHELKIKKQTKWDGFWRVLVFDVSEEDRGARDALRRKITELGFYSLQKSTFIYPYECRGEIEFIGDYFGIRKSVRYFVAHDIDVDKEAFAFFKIKRKKPS